MARTPRTELRVDGAAIVAAIAPASSALPARFAAPLPVIPGEIGGFVCDAPPHAWIVERLRAGDVDMQRRFLDACARVAAGDEQIVAGHMASWLMFTASDPRGAAFIAHLFSPGVLEDRLRGHLHESLAFRGRYDRALAAALGLAPPDFGAHGEPSGDTSFVDDVEWTARALFDGDEADGRRALYDANACAERPLGVSALLRRRPDAIVEAVVALEAFIESPGRGRLERMRRLDELYAIHPASARSLLGRVDDLSPLLALADDGARDRYAAEIGLAIDGAPAGIALDSALDADSFDMETDVYPNGTDGILRRLASRSTALAGVVFDEIPHVSDDDRSSDEMLPDRYRLRAYDAGLLFEVVCGDESDWIDVAAVIGLLNAILAHKRDPSRFLLAADGQDARVLCASTSAVDRAVSDGLLFVDTDVAWLGDDAEED